MPTEPKAIVEKINEQLVGVSRGYARDLPGLLMRSHENIGKIVAEEWQTIRGALEQKAEAQDG